MLVLSRTQQSESVLQVSNRHWETNRDRHSALDRFLRKTRRLLFDVHKGSRDEDSLDVPINGTSTQERRRDHVGANWSLV